MVCTGTPEKMKKRKKQNTKKEKKGKYTEIEAVSYTHLTLPTINSV